jgi:hypothetical protein
MERTGDEMKKYNKSQVLEARVDGVNEAHAYANELYPKLAAVFKPLVGKPVEKVTGGLFEKYKKLLPELPSTVPIHVYKNSSNYTLSWVVKSCKTVTQPDGYGHAYYYEATVYIGDLQNGVLTQLYDPPNFKTDFSAADIAVKRVVYKKAQEIADKAKSDLFPFGEYDR